MDRSNFGPNEWLLDEMYRRYVDDPASVSDAWREFLEDYTPRDEGPAPERKGGPGLVPGRESEGGDKPRPTELLRGAAAVIARRMEESLDVPTATSVRSIPAKLLEVNRSIVNRHLQRRLGRGKVSFTHLIAWAVVRAVVRMPGMNVTFDEVDGKPAAERHEHVTLGVAVDVKRGDGTRTLLVPNVKEADTLAFREFWQGYEEQIRKVRDNKLSPDDVAGTTITVTNPGTVGTVQSVPRLMPGQAAIIGVGAVQYPAGYEGADPDTLAEIGVGKVVTLTSTYDHRVIQGAESGEFLGLVHRLLLGEDRFYDEIFESMEVPYEPVRWHVDEQPPQDSVDRIEKHARVLQLINMYRVRGHLIADLDPLSDEPHPIHPELDPHTHGFTIWDLDREFVTGGLAGEDVMRLGDVLALLRDAYCRTLGVEYMHIQEPEQKAWIQERVEGVDTALPKEDHVHILHKLNEAEALEGFLHRKYVGHRRYSLEGAESLIPMLDALLDDAADSGMDEAVIGMSHRGRLNVLANIVGKSYGQLFREFEGELPLDLPQGSGDVKYHVGATGKRTSRTGHDIGVEMASNPSHLESVDPVVEGMARAKQDARERGGDCVLPVLLHGDAAFAGQGVVQETLNLSQLRGYRTGGTVHVVVNNQIGFTTGSEYGRSSTYASDVAKMVQAPILHVNGDDPEACVRAARLAFGFRQAFHKDVVIDMWCYRRWGHQEVDDPSFTQPLMYRAIERRRSVRKLYMEALVNRGDLSLEEAERSLTEFQERLQQAFDETHGADTKPVPQVELQHPEPAPVRPFVETAVPRERLDEVVTAITTVPDDFHLHPKIEKGLEQRRRALAGDAVDWALGEALAFGTLLRDGVAVRLAGQDSRRGTFSQRHSVLVDQETSEEYTPLAQLGRFFVYDSLLSENAALGFEYGYSVANPDALVLWEAQFGDFVNGAQVVIDGFVSAGEDKWGQHSGLVLLLPHGYEGQGPEHSSARLERFLELSAEDNWQVVVPSTPAQLFHLLRRQALRDLRKPLVVMTPKSLLRLRAAFSPAAAFTEGTFQEVLPEPLAPHPSVVTKVILCQGKVFHDLAKARDERDVQGVALVRLEQLYPFPAHRLEEVLGEYGDAEIRWVQEEPANMGAWSFVRWQLRDRLRIDAVGVTRSEGAAPATGSMTLHQREQDDLVERALAGT
ncbi:MAG: multifunctional oxoglutarate decarboxylase/oxoglutarate dehydrogenase thiamine pyrophosphate-binding subunit/dihydrolipoyllysine-residue succinyltransferase subunit [Actinomycetota bacterium]